MTGVQRKMCKSLNGAGHCSLKPCSTYVQPLTTSSPRQLSPRRHEMRGLASPCPSATPSPWSGAKVLFGSFYCVLRSCITTSLSCSLACAPWPACTT
jgi:hypothetical protein